tara:strand:+ start:1871 stop:2794 length:924 start_codon:yes stop_codon:yes gene_type:complete
MKLVRPKFWLNKNLLSYLFFPFSIITLCINKYKKLLIKKKFSIKTICVGNINVGGTGKTTLAIEIYKILNKDFKTVLIKKKYDHQKDELRLLKKNGDTLSEKSRINSLTSAQKKNYKVAVLDDGLQQKDISYNIAIVCFNSNEGFGNRFLLPAGPLRENISELKNYDIAFIIGKKKNSKLYSDIKSKNKHIKIFQGRYKPKNLHHINKKDKYFMFCGIGNPKEFENTLNKYRIKIKDKKIYPDHYKMSSNEIKKIKEISKKKSLTLITTEKDYLRLEKNERKGVKFIKISLEINKYNNFKKLLLSKV